MRPNVASWVEVLARIGYLAKGVLYLTICALAARMALGVGGTTQPDREQAIAHLYEEPLGRVLVGIITVGLVGYAAWCFIDAFANHDRSAKALATRAGRFGTGVSHLGLAVGAIALALGHASHDEHDIPATRAVVIGLWIAAGCFVAFGGYEMYRAFATKLGLDARAMRRVLVIVSRFGIAARAIVFITSGVLCAYAAHEQEPAHVGGTAASLGAILAFGWWPYLVIAIGLGAYGVYQLINAKFRRIWGLTASPL